MSKVPLFFMQSEVSNIHFRNMQDMVEYKLQFHYTISVVRTLKHHSSGLMSMREFSQLFKKFCSSLKVQISQWYFFSGFEENHWLNGTCLQQKLSSFFYSSQS